MLARAASGTPDIGSLTIRPSIKSILESLKANATEEVDLRQSSVTVEELHYIGIFLSVNTSVTKIR